MTMTVGDFLVERLSEWGVTRIFGYPGDGINGVFGALARAEGKIQFIQARHEEMAAFMASAHAKFTGELGVCIATSGPGASHLITGLYDARMDHMPVLAIVGQQARAALGGHYQQELDLLSMFKDVAGAFVQQASAPAQVRHLLDRAVRTAIGERRVTAIILPNDLQDLPYEAPGRAHGTVHSGVGYSKPRVLPFDADLQRAAEVLNQGEKVAILVGAGALQASDQVLAVAEKLGAGVAKALLGKAVLPDDLPWVTGSIGLLGTEPSYKLMSECDTLLMIGSGFPYSEFLPREGQARGVQIDLQPDMLSLRYPMEVNLVGDSAETLAALLPLLEQKTSNKWRKKVEGWRSSWEKSLERRAMAKADPINPQRVVYELSPRLPDAAIITSDSGSCANWYARDLKIRHGMQCSLSGGLASMGAAWSISGMIEIQMQLADHWPACADVLTPEMRFGIQATLGKYGAEARAKIEARRAALNQRMHEIFQEADFVITASNPDVAFNAEGPLPSDFGGLPGGMGNNGKLTFPANMYGNPAISIPSGLVDGLPVALQINGRHFSEQLLLELGLAMERSRPWALVAPNSPI